MTELRTAESEETPWMAAAQPARFAYKPALDGLRAVAVMAVIAYHFGLGWLQGGFLGVDTFFVLSGYLITSLLLIEWSGNTRIKLWAFWGRRFRRLMPALLLVIAGIAIWTRIVASSDSWGAMRGDSLWTLFYGANWHFILSKQSYFTADPSMFRHAWSLAIEEQFYFVWPVIVIAALKIAKGRHQVLAGVCGVGALASALLMSSMYSPTNDVSRAYYGTDARASQLLVGALLAIVLIHWGPKQRFSKSLVQVVGMLAAATIVWAFWAASDQGSFLYHGGFLLFAIAVALFIMAAVQTTANPLRGVLSVRPVRWIGQVSYGLYLWHWPVSIALTGARLASWGWSVNWVVVLAIRLAVTFVIAALSYYLVELPVRQHRFVHMWTSKSWLPASVVAMVVLVLVLTTGSTSNVLAQAPGTNLESAPTQEVTAPGSGPLGTLTQRSLMLGDSVAYSLGDALVAEAAGSGVVFKTMARLGCGLTTGVWLLPTGRPVDQSQACADEAAAFEADAIAANTPDVVLWLSTWEIGDFRVNGKRITYGSPEYEAWINTEFERVRQLAKAAGSRLVFVTNAPRGPNPLQAVTEAETQRSEYLNSLFRAFAAEHAEDTGVLDLGAIVCPDGIRCPATMDGVALRPKDGGHFVPEGAAWTAPRFLESLRVALEKMQPR